MALTTIRNPSLATIPIPNSRPHIPELNHGPCPSKTIGPNHSLEPRPNHAVPIHTSAQTHSYIGEGTRIPDHTPYVGYTSICFS